VADEVKQLPAPESQRDDWLIPVLVFFGMFVVVLLIVLGNSQKTVGLTLADKEAASLPPQVAFLQPEDGAEVGTTFTVSFAAMNVVVEAAGEVHEHAGHFHVLVDVPFVESGQIIPRDESHLHFGDGALSAEITLEPGEHTLRLQFADGAHMALEGDGYRDEIVVTVVE